MDVNTTIVVIVDGGLILFFLYALYTILSPNLNTRGIKKDLKSSTQEPVYPQMHRFSEEKLEPQESIPREEYEAEPVGPTPIRYEPPEYEAEPTEPQESIPREEYEAELLDYQAREEELPRIKKHEREQ